MHLPFLDLPRSRRIFAALHRGGRFKGQPLSHPSAARSSRRHPSNRHSCNNGVLLSGSRKPFSSRYSRPSFTSFSAWRSIASLRSGPVLSNPKRRAVSTTKSSREIAAASAIIVVNANRYSSGAIIVARRSDRAAFRRLRTAVRICPLVDQNSCSLSTLSLRDK